MFGVLALIFYVMVKPTIKKEKVEGEEEENVDIIKKESEISENVPLKINENEYVEEDEVPEAPKRFGQR